MTVETAAPRFTLHQTPMQSAGFAADVKSGLTAARKSIPPHHFYDALGSALFAAICELPEYYVTRAETELLTVYAEEVVSVIGTPARICELGPGNARKTRLLFDRMSAPFEYVPLDVDAATLELTGRQLIAEYPQMTVSAVQGDFRHPSRAIRALAPAAGPTAVLFLGSSIGNLEHDPAVRLLRDLRSALAPGEVLLLGADLRKAAAILEPAYDDALGVTAAFNLNLLQRINRELGGHFDLATFAHRAFYDFERGRIEMHLVSLRDQTVRIDDLELEVLFAESETIHTESSHKYDETTLTAMAAASGFVIERTWTDSHAWFADVAMRAI